MAWPQNPRPAKALLVYRQQINALAPNRSGAAEGTAGLYGGMIGDEAHQGRVSDHNPNKNGVVLACDITHDPAHGMDSYRLAEQLLGSRDERIKYVISNRKIASGTGQNHPAWVWRTYEGDNPHDLHVHLSLKDDSRLYDTEDPWVLQDRAPAPTPPTTRATVRRGDSGEDVKAIQRLIMVDGEFGALTEIAVMQFQGMHGLYPDGIVGPYTWRELEKLKVTIPPVPGAEWQRDIIATIFGGSGDPQHSAYDGHLITDTEMGLALPYRFSSSTRRVEVEGPAGVGEAPVIDVGPWNISDPYWETPGKRPQAESGTDLSGRSTNGAGIDLTPALARKVGIDGKGKVNWRFV